MPVLSPVHTDAALDLAPTVAEIDLGALRRNARRLRRRADAPLMAVVKADAYGHGAVPVARALQAEGVARFAVATVPEAIRLREAGLDAPLLVFAAPLPAWLPAYAAHGLDVTVSSPAVAEAVCALARPDAPLRVHVKVDTGMGRIGLAPTDVPAVLDRLRAAEGVEVVGLWTHFASADDPDDPFTDAQLRRFRALDAGADDLVLHTANSSALVHHRASVDDFPRTLARTGLALYGLLSDEAAAAAVGLEPVMRFVSTVTHVKTVAPGTSVSYGRTWTAARPTRIATVAAGYADGYHRLLSNRAEVGIRGRRWPLAGTVCMDMVMVDLGAPDGPGAAVRPGDPVVLMGAGGPTAYEVARWAETIPYEVCCSVGARVPRRYGGAADADAAGTPA